METQTGSNRKLSSDRRVFNIISVVLLSLLTQDSILTDGYRLLPKIFSLEAYQFLFKAPEDMLHAYGVTIFVTAVGTFSSMIVTSMAAYVLSSRDFTYRNTVSFFFYFTTVFGGGLVPWYIFNMKYLHFKNNYISLILPTLVNVTYLLILKSYMANIPEAVFESARLDGANDWTIYRRIALPLSKAGLATVGLFIALNYLNDILNKSQGMMNAAARAGIPSSQVPSEPVKLAMTVVATGPIVLLYPFLQKYFVKGVTIGAVKG